MSETSKYRHLTTAHCEGNGVDIGSGGDPVVPWAINFDLPNEAFLHYHSQQPGVLPIQFGGDALNLPFKDRTLDFVYSSHLLEDFADWKPALMEWSRVLKIGGKLIVLIPDKERWNEAVQNGQPPNCAHRHEGTVGELTQNIEECAPCFRVFIDELTNLTPKDYTILFVAQKVS